MAVQSNARDGKPLPPATPRTTELSSSRFRALESSAVRRVRPNAPPRKRELFRQRQQAEQSGYRACLRCRPKAVDGNPQSALVRGVCRYIEQHLEDRLTLAMLAQQFRRSPFHLQRTFKSALGVSPKAYIDTCRLRQVKQNSRPDTT